MAQAILEKPSLRADIYQRRNRRMLVGVGLLVLAMGGLAFASVPLYRIFCQVTGFGGTTQITSIVSQSVSLNATPVEMLFDANVSPQLNWSFVPITAPTKILPGEQITAIYRATNLGDTPSIGTATFNVTPQKAGPYFMKLECFCFTEQALQPGESMDMPVTFYLDSEIADDINTQDIDQIVLSYTFFRAKNETF